MSFVPKHHFHKNALKSEVFQFRIGELATMTGVSTRQLRYWESKGIISSLSREGEQDARVYNYKTYVAVAAIKGFLDDGYTLKEAVEKTHELEQSWRVLHEVMSQAVKGVIELDGKNVVDLGYFDDEQQQRLFATIDDDNKVHYIVRRTDEN